MTTVVVYAGGFQPFHQGHLSSYLQAKKAFPDADFYVATSANVKERPIPYEQKKFLATQAGVNPEDFPDVVVRSPLNPTEILSKYDPEKDTFILVRSERDPVGYTKKDGTPGYFQPYQQGAKLEPFGKHGYVYVTSKHDFDVNGENVYSGTQIRDMYKNVDDKTRSKIIKQLYPNSKQQKQIKNVLDTYLTDQAVTMESIKLLYNKIKPMLAEATPEQQEKLYSLLSEAKNKLAEYTVGQTRKFIKKAHKTQRYGDKPYSSHPISVANTGKKFFGSKFNGDAVKAALLHDVIEDTHFTKEDLEKRGFSPEVIEAVQLLSKDKSLSYEDNIRKIISSGNKIAMMVKYCDNYVNYTGDKSNWDPKKAEASQKKYLNSLNMLGKVLGVDKHTEVSEAANPAQQAAIAISMKKAGKKPKKKVDETIDYLPEK